RYGTVGCNRPGLGSRGRHDIIERLMAQSQILAKAERFSRCYGIDSQRHVVDDLDCLTATRISGMHNLTSHDFKKRPGCVKGLLAATHHEAECAFCRPRRAS